MESSLSVWAKVVGILSTISLLAGFYFLSVNVINALLFDTLQFNIVGTQENYAVADCVSLSPFVSSSCGGSFLSQLNAPHNYAFFAIFLAVFAILSFIYPSTIGKGIYIVSLLLVAFAVLTGGFASLPYFEPVTFDSPSATREYQVFTLGNAEYSRAGMLINALSLLLSSVFALLTVVILSAVRKSYRARSYERQVQEYASQPRVSIDQMFEDDSLSASQRKNFSAGSSAESFGGREVRT